VQSKIANESVAAIKNVHGMDYTPGPIARTICELTERIANEVQ